MKLTCVLILMLLGAGAEPAPPVPQSLAYVLQADSLGGRPETALARLRDCGRDWIIMDPSFDGTDDTCWTAEDVIAIRGGKTGRRIFAYVSIGEAEDYRGYWRAEWDANSDGRPDAGAPSYLCEQNPQWQGNYRVRYWTTAWQAIVLERVRDAVRRSYDGLYLDAVDAFEYFEYDASRKDWIDDRANPQTGRTYRQDMITFVARIAEETRKGPRPMLVVPQNGAQLLADDRYRATIDAIGVEDLFTEGNRVQDEEHTSGALAQLRKLKATSKPVLVIEYATRRVPQTISIEGAKKEQFLLLLTDRDLKTLGKGFGPGGEPFGSEMKKPGSADPAAGDP